MSACFTINGAKFVLQAKEMDIRDYKVMFFLMQLVVICMVILCQYLNILILQFLFLAVLAYKNYYCLYLLFYWVLQNNVFLNL